MNRAADSIEDIARRLRSDNPETRARAIVDLDFGGYDEVELVKPLTDDSEPFMFGTPVKDLAWAYIERHGGPEYSGNHSLNVKKWISELGNSENRSAVSGKLTGKPDEPLQTL